MKYATAAVALAGLAAAQNMTTLTPPTSASSTTTVDVWTTLTICDYTIVTVTDCGPEIIDCPAHQKTVVRTKENYVPVTTTVCPVASYGAVVAALPPTQKILPAPTPAAPVPGYPGPIPPVIPVPVPPAGPIVNATNTPTAPTASVTPYTGAASMVSGSVGAVIVGVLAALAF